MDLALPFVVFGASLARVLARRAPVAAVPLAGSGALMIYGGVRLMRNDGGWAEQFAQAAWTDRGLHPVSTARAMGGGWLLMGLIFIAVAVGVGVQ